MPVLNAPALPPAPFVDIWQVTAHLRIDGMEAEEDLDLKILAASERIREHLNGASPYQPEVDGAGLPVRDADGNVVYTKIVRPMVKAATLLLIGYLYRYPTGDERKAFDDSKLPAPVTAMLSPIRRRTLA